MFLSSLDVLRLEIKMAANLLPNYLKCIEVRLELAAPSSLQQFPLFAYDEKRLNGSGDQGRGLIWKPEREG
uniref:Uncharacterized protein n=1 Tax=Arundo donax TaxID=35708 RepID=A0A0A8Z6T6_ARUDO